MAGSIYGTLFRVSTWGESHGRGIGLVIDGCPAGLSLCEADIQKYLDRRKPGKTCYATTRKEEDKVELLSGIFEGRTTGTPIAMAVYNTSQQSKDYSEIANYYRPGHADYTFDQKYGFRDYRGGGRSSGRETIARVAAGAVAAKILEELGIIICTYAKTIGPITTKEENFDRLEIHRNPFCMPDAKAAERAAEFLDEKMKDKDSVGGVIECRVEGLPTGIGEPVFDKLSANLAKAVMSIGAVKGFEIGDGFEVSKNCGSQNNDVFYIENEKVKKRSNHSGGVLGGISDGSELLFRAAIKPTPSISRPQQTVNKRGENIEVSIKGRHDPIIVPRAVVVVESMAAIAITDLLFESMTSTMNGILSFFGKKF